MKHYTYGTITKINMSQLWHNFKRLLKVNIKTTFTIPKSIWYSIRYNSGENFILNEKSLYPYVYDVSIPQSERKEPVRLSTQLLASVTDLKYLKYCNKNLGENLKYSIDHNEINKNLEKSFDELFKTYKFNISNSNFELPAAVSARVLYASAMINYYDKTVHSFIFNTFLNKLEHADADSIAQVLFVLSENNIFEPEKWNPLIDCLSRRLFQPEFTSVSFNMPSISLFRETKTGMNLKHMNEFGSKLFSEGYLNAFEAYHSLKKAEEKGNGINTGIIQDLEKRLPLLKTNFQEYQNYHLK